MACRTSFRTQSRPDFFGLRVLPTLMSIAIIATARFVEVAAFAEGADGKFSAGSNAASGGDGAGAPIESAAAGGGELESWESGFDRSDACAHNRDVAEACGACPGLAPALGISVWQCCSDVSAQRLCFETVASFLVDRAVSMSASDEGADQDDEETEDVVEKRAKYFLGKRAKYFLGKRSFGSRRMGGYRPAMHHRLMSEDFALLGSGRRSHADGQMAAEKRAKYFLG